MRMRIAILLLGVFGLLLAGGIAQAAITNVKGSEDFDYQYNFDAANSFPDNHPLVNEDGNSNKDFSLLTGTSHTQAISAGILTLDSSSAIAGTDYYRSSLSDEIWPGLNVTLAAGHTVEASAHVVAGSQVGPVAMALHSFPSDNVNSPYLYIAKDGEIWGSNYLSPVASWSHDNTDGFHVFRYAQNEGSAVYSLWRDNQLLSDSLAPGMVEASPLNRMLFGDGSSNYGAKLEIDYVRFTKGAFAPVPEPSPLTLLAVGGLFGLLALRRRCS